MELAVDDLWTSTCGWLVGVAPWTLGLWARSNCYNINIAGVELCVCRLTGGLSALNRGRVESWTDFGVLDVVQFRPTSLNLTGIGPSFMLQSHRSDVSRPPFFFVAHLLLSTTFFLANGSMLTRVYQTAAYYDSLVRTSKMSPICRPSAVYGDCRPHA